MLAMYVRTYVAYVCNVMECTYGMCVWYLMSAFYVLCVFTYVRVMIYECYVCMVCMYVLYVRYVCVLRMNVGRYATLWYVRMLCMCACYSCMCVVYVMHLCLCRIRVM